MAEKSTEKGFELYTIVSPDGYTKATFVPEKGGVGSSIIMPHNDTEREILYLRQNFWEKGHFDLHGGWPFLFPICARLERNGIAGNYLYDGSIYNMPIHGFAPYLPWNVIDAERPDELVLELVDNKDSLAMYPFSFKVKLSYKVCDGSLTCEQVYTNTGEASMPYYAGFHPFFLTPKSGEGKEKVMLDYQPTRVLRCNECLTDLVGEKKLFELPISVTDPQISEQLTEVMKNNVVKLEFSDGFNLFMKAKGMEDVNMFKYIQLYTVAKEPFTCIEPWMSFPNALNTVAGVRWLDPGQSEKGIVTLSCIYDKDLYCNV